MYALIDNSPLAHACTYAYGRPLPLSPTGRLPVTHCNRPSTPVVKQFLKVRSLPLLHCPFCLAQVFDGQGPTHSKPECYPARGCKPPALTPRVDRLRPEQAQPRDPLLEASSCRHNPCPWNSSSGNATTMVTARHTSNTGAQDLRIGLLASRWSNECVHASGVSLMDGGSSFRWMAAAACLTPAPSSWIRASTGGRISSTR